MQKANRIQLHYFIPFLCILPVLVLTSCGIFKNNPEESVEKSGNEKENDSKVYIAVEEQPAFPGGKKDLMRYLKGTISYPESAKKSGEEGTVHLQFIVTKEGEIKEPEVIKGVNEALNEEALRVVRNMPDWEPGKQRGEPVNVRYKLPIRFALN